jgi:hypothetical protein
MKKNDYRGALPLVLKTRADEIAQRYKGARLLAVFDGLSYQEAFNNRPDESDPLQIPLFKGTEDEPLAHAGPWLIDVSASDAHASTIDKLEQSFSAVLWLVSADNILTIAQRLRQRLNTKLPDGREAILRWWDPRAARAMDEHLSPASKRALFGAALEWYYLVHHKYSANQYIYIAGEARNEF